MESPLLAMGGTADHVHIMAGLEKTMALSDLLLEVKRDSSKWIKEKNPALHGFGWQDGYFGFSIGDSAVGSLRTYRSRQKENHTTIDFQDEIRAFLKKYGIEWDERYMWE